jgi:hypothetical protein
MKSNNLSPLDSLPYFTLEAVKQIYMDETLVDGTIQTNLYRWMKAGRIIQLKKGIYMTRRFFEQHRADANFAPMISAILIPQSYVSLEFILQRYGILTEITYPISAVTMKQTRKFENKLGTFTYRNIKNELYTGYEIKESMGIPVSLASIAKALFDFFYLRPMKNIPISAKNGIASSLRLNLDDFTKPNQKEFSNYVALSKSRKMERIEKNLRLTVWQR